MKVMKFGGSSVANAENIKRVGEIVLEADGGRKAVVLSAMQETTDALMEVGRLAEKGDASFREKIREIADRHLSVVGELIPNAPTVRELVVGYISDLERISEGVFLLRELSPRSLDSISSFGELLSSRIASEAFIQMGLDNEWHDSRSLIRTDSNFGFAAIDFVTTNRQLRELLGRSRSDVFILPGFVASDADGNVTTLGRGGSDHTAAIIAAAVDADALEIWTDVSGMMSADPRLVKNVKQISKITYREAMELSHFGAKVIYPPTIQPVMAKGIPVRVKNTFSPSDAGTLIEAVTTDEGEIIRGISSIDNIALLNLEGSGMVGIPGFSKRLFETLAGAQINVILITQSSSEHSICVSIDASRMSTAKRVTDAEFEHEILAGKIEPLNCESGYSILALVGDNMRSHTGVSGRMFSVLGHNGINISAIAQGSSERNISAVIRSNDVKKAVNALHEEFFSDGKKQVNVYVAGVGTVGSRLLAQIRKQHDYLAEDLKLNVRVVGIANSRRAVLLDDEDQRIFAEDLKDAPETNIGAFTDAIIANNKRNSVFVDVTASERVVETYPKLLSRSVSIIACNKIACSSDFASYERLRSLAREYNTNFFFETNVGAGLPVISTLNDLLRSGDRVNRIEAVLSGTLNFVFNNYDGSRTFAEVVRQAQDEGYTEPDPRLDLSGTDVARKILILAREAGNRLEMDDIKNTPFLPEDCLYGSVEDFYTALERNEPHFKSLLDEARSKGLSLKYIASFDSGNASVGLQSIGPEHNFANLSGKDNAVLFYTDRYAEQPLVIKGAGAGADVTAAGVFADIIRAARS